MSYDIRMLDRDGNQLYFNDAHQLRGGIYALGGTRELWLNITYNYAPFYYERIDTEKGIRWIYGKSGKEVAPVLARAIIILGTQRDVDYWKNAAGNAGAALADLLVMAAAFPEGVFDGD